MVNMSGAYVFPSRSNHVHDGKHLFLSQSGECLKMKNNEQVALKCFTWISALSPGVSTQNFGGPQCVKTSM